jgi:hypothetical protein
LRSGTRVDVGGCVAGYGAPIDEVDRAPGLVVVRGNDAPTARPSPDVDAEDAPVPEIARPPGFVVVRGNAGPGARPSPDDDDDDDRPVKLPVALRAKLPVAGRGDDDDADDDGAGGDDGDGNVPVGVRANVPVAGRGLVDDGAGGDDGDGKVPVAVRANVPVAGRGLVDDDNEGGGAGATNDDDDDVDVDVDADGRGAAPGGGASARATARSALNESVSVLMSPASSRFDAAFVGFNVVSIGVFEVLKRPRMRVSPCSRTVYAWGVSFSSTQSTARSRITCRPVSADMRRTSAAGSCDDVAIVIDAASIATGRRRCSTAMSSGSSASGARSMVLSARDTATVRSKVARLWAMARSVAHPLATTTLAIWPVSKPHARRSRACSSVTWPAPRRSST